MGFFEKLGEGLRKTRDSIFGSIAGLVNAGEITDELYDDLEEQLILADTGADVAMRLVEELRQEVRRKHLKTGADALEALKGIIREMLRADGEMQLSGRPAVSQMTMSYPRAAALCTASKRTAAGSAPSLCFTTGTSARSAQTHSCSAAAARKVSPAASITRLPCCLYR